MSDRRTILDMSDPPASADVVTLTDDERAELAECEQTIAHGLRTFVDVGRALERVRDARLYREHFDNFETYCAERWGMVRRRAYQLIESAQVVEHVQNFAQLPSSDSVARELVPVMRREPERVADVWATAVEQHGPKPTAAQVRDVVAELVPKPRKRAEPRSDERRRRERRAKLTEHLRTAAAQLRVAATMLDDEHDDLMHLTDPALEGWTDLMRRVDEARERIHNALTGGKHGKS